jgi:hypothetical protein
MNSETHSWMHSFDSLAILAVGGRASFMMRATLAICPSNNVDDESAPHFTQEARDRKAEAEERGREDVPAGTDPARDTPRPGRR